MTALRRTAGQTSAEYLGVLLVVAVIIAVLAQADIGERLRVMTVRTICLSLNAAEDCPPSYEQRRRGERAAVATAAGAGRPDPQRRVRELRHGDRRIFDARNGPRLRARLLRRPGDGPSGRREADRVFANLGRIYDYWNVTFGRES